MDAGFLWRIVEYRDLRDVQEDVIGYDLEETGVEKIKVCCRLPDLSVTLCIEV